MSIEYDNKYASYDVRNHHIQITIKTLVVLDIDAAQQIVKDRMRLQGGKIFSAVLDIREMEDSTKQGRDFLGKNGWFFCERVGILADERKTMVIAMFYLNFSKPSTTTIIFFNEKDALAFVFNNK